MLMAQTRLYIRRQVGEHLSIYPTPLGLVVTCCDNITHNIELVYQFHKSVIPNEYQYIQCSMYCCPFQVWNAHSLNWESSPSGDWTHDLKIDSLELYQLSYQRYLITFAGILHHNKASSSFSTPVSSRCAFSTQLHAVASPTSLLVDPNFMASVTVFSGVVLQVSLPGFTH